MKSIPKCRVCGSTAGLAPTPSGSVLCTVCAIKELYELAGSVKEWWEDAQYLTSSTGDGDEMNFFDEPPDFVEKSVSHLES